MPWFKVDDKFHSHPKVMELDPRTVGIWTLAGTWCADYLTDGLISGGQLRRLGGSEEDAQKLVEAGLWEPAEEGWQFRDWIEYQPSREAVEQERRSKEDSGKQAAHKRWHVGRGVVSPDCELCVPNAESKGDSSRPFSEPYRYTHGSPNAESMRNDAPEPEPVPLINHPSSAKADDDGFEDWWQHYPKKVNKGDARKKYAEALKKTTHQRLVEGAKGYANYCANTGREKRYIKGPDRWLNVEGWANTDELDAPKHHKPSKWDYGPEAYMHPEEVEDERRRAEQQQRHS